MQIACPLMESYPRLKEHFGTIVSQLRSEKGVSQQIVADTCNLERAYVSRLERGIAQPTITTVFKLADYFGIKPSELIDMVYNLSKKPRK